MADRVRLGIGNAMYARQIEELLQRIAAAPYDPGDSDLDDEQPRRVMLTIGDIRLAKRLAGRG